MEQKTLLPDAGEVVVESVKVEGRGLLLMMLRACGDQNFCPQCHRSSTRVHSHYQRSYVTFPGKGYRSGFSCMCGASFATPKDVDSGSSPSGCQTPCTGMLAELAG